MFKHRLAPAGAAAQQGTNARQQLVNVIGFEHVVVGAGIESGDAVGHAVAGRGDQHRHGAPALAQGAQHVQAVASG